MAPVRAKGLQNELAKVGTRDRHIEALGNWESCETNAWTERFSVPGARRGSGSKNRGSRTQPPRATQAGVKRIFWTGKVGEKDVLALRSGKRRAAKSAALCREAAKTRLRFQLDQDNFNAFAGEVFGKVLFLSKEHGFTGTPASLFTGSIG